MLLAFNWYKYITQFFKTKKTCPRACFFCLILSNYLFNTCQISFPKINTIHLVLSDSITTKYKNYDGAKFIEIKKDTVTNIQNMNNVIIKTYKYDVKPRYINKEFGRKRYIKFIFLVWIMIIFVTMAYSPIAAFLVEMFPTKIRYTSMSLPYHIGNGVFGGLVPFIATLLATTFTKDPLVGLWYPIGVAFLCFIIGAFYLTNKINNDVND